MPQFQVLPANPSFGSQLGQALGSGLSEGIGTALSQYFKQKEIKKQASGLSPLFEQLGVPKEGISQMLQAGLSPDQLLNIGQVIQKQQATQQKTLGNQQKAESEQRVGQEAFDRMSTLLKEGNLGLGSKARSKVFGGKTAEDVGEFESLSGALESMLVDRVSRGTLSNARFKYITETLLPKANDRDATIRGKLKALARELDLDSATLLENSEKTEKKELTEGQLFASLPDASEHPNAIFSKGSKRFQSNGSGWKEIK